MHVVRAVHMLVGLVYHGHFHPRSFGMPSLYALRERPRADFRVSLSSPSVSG